MKARVLVLVFVLVAGVAGAAQVVLNGGKVLEVESAAINGGYVYVTYASGQMQAYALDEVDLEASGLLPAEAPDTGEDKPQKAKSIAEATAKSTGASSVKITDQDVSHVRGSGTTAEGEEAEGPTPEEVGAAAALVISNLSQQMAGSMVNLSGNVNNAGTKSVASITLEAKAVNKAGEDVGSGSTTISQTLEPKGQVGFTLSFPVTGPVVDIKVRAVAAVAAFDFQSTTPPMAGAEQSQ